MKIIENKSCEIVFGKLKQGDVFRDQYGNYCMKIEPFEDNHGANNFITLTDGCIGGWTNEDAFVTKVDCELVIKY